MRLANEGTLADRITRLSVIVAIGAGALTAVSAGVVADRLVAIGDDARLSGTARGLLEELVHDWRRDVVGEIAVDREPVCSG